MRRQMAKGHRVLQSKFTAQDILTAGGERPEGKMGLEGFHAASSVLLASWGA